VDLEDVFLALWDQAVAPSGWSPAPLDS
jgi:hypothetical protein